MDTNRHSSPESQADRVDLYTLGMLSATEAAEFEADLNAGRIAQQELDESLQTLTALCEEAASVMPTPRKAVKDALMAAISDAPAEPAQKEQIFLYANQGEWTEMAPGITIRVLHVNDADNRTMFLVRMVPGAAYPTHRHMGLEECLVIEGDLEVDGRVLRSGDFTATYDDKIHIDTHSNEGCLLLITSPMNDEFLDHDH